MLVTQIVRVYLDPVPWSQRGILVPYPRLDTLRLCSLAIFASSLHIHGVHVSVRCCVRLSDGILVAGRHGVVPRHLLRVGCGPVHAVVTALRAWGLVL